MLNFINNEFNELGGCSSTCMTLRTVAAEVKKSIDIVENLGPLHLSFVCAPGASSLTSSLI